MPIQRHFIRNVPVDDLEVSDLVQQAVKFAGMTDRGRYICYLNAHVYNLARQNPRLQAVLSRSSICYADGASVVWAANRFGGQLGGRLTAADFFPEVIQSLVESQRRVFILGGKPGIAERAAAELGRRASGFTPVGVHHGFFDTSRESDQVVAAIRETRPHVLVVGMGTPKQELWIADHLDKLGVPLVWAVGALLDYCAGEERRCPDWMGNHGLEWLYRLILNPRRRALRYLLGNPRFVWSVLTARPHPATERRREPLADPSVVREQCSDAGSKPC